MDGLELEGVSSLLLILILIDADYVAVVGHLGDNGLERCHSLVHLLHLIVDGVDLLLHINELVADELSASACKKSGCHNAC